MSELRPDWRARLAALRQCWVANASESGGQACVISSATNIRYLTGLDASAGLLVQSRDREYLVIDGRYTAVAAEAISGNTVTPLQIATVDTTYDAALSDVLTRIGASRIIFEADDVTVSGLGRWRQAFPADWQGSSGLVEGLRLLKDPYEIGVFRRAGAALAGVASRLGEWVAVGRTELEVAAAINAGLAHAGFSRPAFETIVASGPNSAHPHAKPGNRRLSEGDLVVLDFGGVLDGYCVDLTRMAGVGRPRAEAIALYRAVLDAQQAALDMIGAGVAAGAVDAAARQLLDARGLGAAFVHGTGHGLGLEVHEAPRLSRLANLDDVLRPGMVCTIEPGAYVPGIGGARLEDDVLVTDTGAELLTAGPRDLVIV